MMRCSERPVNVVIENYETGGLDYDRDQSAQWCHIDLDAKFHRDRSSNAVGTMVALEELQTIRASQGISAATHRTQVAHCTVYYECRRSDSPKHADQMLGTRVIFFPEVNTMLGMSFSPRFP